jgi:hypothetical protein
MSAPTDHSRDCLLAPFASDLLLSAGVGQADADGATHPTRFNQNQHNIGLLQAAPDTEVADFSSAARCRATMKISSLSCAESSGGSDCIGAEQVFKSPHDPDVDN